MLATAQSLNRYSYVYNNPFKFKDPSGHAAIPANIGVSAVIGAVGGFLIDAGIKASIFCQANRNRSMRGESATENAHLYRWHGGSYRNDTFGEPVDPSYLEEF